MVTIIPTSQLGNKPEWIHCPFCSTDALTTLEQVDPIGEANGLMLFLCCCMPVTVYKTLFAKDIRYRCSNCQNEVAYRHRVNGITVREPPAHIEEEYTSQGEQMKL
ncbi:hypothetical protein VHEMI08334 [[Torrubiella] hemipterigena]|uniref:LITAF domain-containing protein n=1 Tax=[Torrubiella] hemipterigena TaxID=1531966 RepID=A0A0A1TN21_9HYPO|nr:hypothetical protein VHEMI08334 [[Torrubiella] hemipterigena]